MAVRRVMRRLPGARFVLKTDVASYYASIDHARLLDQLAALVPDRNVLNLVGQMLCRVSEGGGLYHEFRRGIPLGCPLSPLLGAFFLDDLDERLEATGLGQDVHRPRGARLRLPGLPAQPEGAFGGEAHAGAICRT